MKDKRISLALGTSNFRELVTKSEIFVDKTLFILAITQASEKAILITRPRRWGKTLSLDMLKTFLGIEVDNNGDKLDVNSNRVLFEGGEVKIISSATGSEEIVDVPKSKLAQLSEGAHLGLQGQYPVIFISFKDATATNYLEVEQRIKEKVAEVFEQHCYLTNSKNLNAPQKQKLEECLNGKFERVSICSSLKFLSEILKAHHKMSVYILVDEYDKPVSDFLAKSFTTNIDERNRVASLVTSIMSACGKDNDCLEKIILTGVLDAFQKESGSGFNNVIVFGLSSIKFSRHFGFSEDEVMGLVKKFEVDKAEETILANIKAWYNGYTLSISIRESIQVYTPWSVMRYLSSFYDTKNLQPKSYWVDSGVNELLDNLSKYKLSSGLLDKLKSLADGQKIALNLPETFKLLQSISDVDKLPQRIEATITYLLFNSGYISKDKDLFVIPNQEILEYFKECVLDAWVEKEVALNKLDAKDTLLKELSVCLSNAEEFKKKVQELILDKVSGGDKTENYFQSLVGGVIELYAIHNGIGATHNVLSENSVHSGRIDNIFYPKKVLLEPSFVCAGDIPADAPSPHSLDLSSVIIHEYKKLDSTTAGELDRVLDEAMWQILEKGYLEEPLSKKEAHSHLHAWNKIKIRSIVFIRDESIGKWSADLAEKELTLKEASILEKFFSNKLVRDELGLLSKSKRSEISSCRKRFLQAINKIVEAKADNLVSAMTLIDTILKEEQLLNALRKSKIAALLKTASNTGNIFNIIVNNANPEAGDICSKIKASFSEDIPEKMIELLADYGRKGRYHVCRAGADLPFDRGHASSHPQQLVHRSIRSRRDYGKKLEIGSVVSILKEIPEVVSGLTLKDVPGDGNCFFHAVERQLAKIGTGFAPMTYRDLRQLAANYVRGHRFEFEDFMACEDSEQYLSKIEKDKQWADHVLIKALALELNINIVILQQRHEAEGSLNEPVIITRDSGLFDRTIFLYHVSEIHYKSIESINIECPKLYYVLNILRESGVEVPALFTPPPIVRSLPVAAGAASGGYAVDSVKRIASGPELDAADNAALVAGTSIDGAASSSGACSSRAIRAADDNTVMCVTDIIYDNPIFNDNSLLKGKILQEAHRVGGIALVDRLLESGVKHGSTPHLLEYFDRHTKRVLFNFDTKNKVGSGGNLGLHLKLVENTEVIVMRESPPDHLYTPFIRLIQSIAQTHNILFNPWHWSGQIGHVIQKMVESVHPALQTDYQTRMLSFLIDLLEYIGSADPVIMPTYFPHQPIDPDDFEGGGGGGGGGGGDDKKPDDAYSGFGSMISTAPSDNTSANVTNIMWLAGVESMNG